jgi:HEAT repeat protein
MRLVPCTLAFLLSASAVHADFAELTAQKKDESTYTGPTRKEFRGKSLDDWIKEIGSRDRSHGVDAIHAVLMFGPQSNQALPTLFNLLEKHNSLNRLDTSTRVNAIIAIGAILGNTKSPDPGDVKTAVSLLRRFLSDGQSIVKFRAVEALGRIGPEAHSVIPELISYGLRDVNSFETREAAAIALGRIAHDPKKRQPPAAEVLNALYRYGLTSPEYRVRLAAIQALAYLGGPAQPNLRIGFVKNLEPLAQRDPEPSLRIWGHMAIMSISGNFSEIRIAAISKLLTHRSLEVRVQSAQALAALGTKAKSAVKSLTAALADRDPDMTMAVINALASLENWGKSSIPGLQKVANDMSRPEVVRATASQAIKHINGELKASTK